MEIIASHELSKKIIKYNEEEHCLIRNKEKIDLEEYIDNIVYIRGLFALGIYVFYDNGFEIEVDSINADFFKIINVPLESWNEMHNSTRERMKDFVISYATKMNISILDLDKYAIFDENHYIVDNYLIDKRPRFLDEPHGPFGSVGHIVLFNYKKIDKAIKENDCKVAEFLAGINDLFKVKEIKETSENPSLCGSILFAENRMIPLKTAEQLETVKKYFKMKPERNINLNYGTKETDKNNEEEGKKASLKEIEKTQIKTIKKDETISLKHLLFKPSLVKLGDESYPTNEVLDHIYYLSHDKIAFSKIIDGTKCRIECNAKIGDSLYNELYSLNKKRKPELIGQCKERYLKYKAKQQIFYYRKIRKNVYVKGDYLLLLYYMNEYDSLPELPKDRIRTVEDFLECDLREHFRIINVREEVASGCGAYVELKNGEKVNFPKFEDGDVYDKVFEKQFHETLMYIHLNKFIDLSFEQKILKAISIGKDNDRKFEEKQNMARQEKAKYLKDNFGIEYDSYFNLQGGIKKHYYESSNGKYSISFCENFVFVASNYASLSDAKYNVFKPSVIKYIELGEKKILVKQGKKPNFIDYVYGGVNAAQALHNEIMSTPDEYRTIPEFTVHFVDGFEFKRFSDEPVLKPEKITFTGNLPKDVYERYNAQNVVMNNMLREFEKTKAEAPKTVDKFEEIRKYKELLDSGIITQEEFDKKKKEILGL